MIPKRLLASITAATAAAGNGESGTFQILHPAGSYQVCISAAAVVVIQGRMAPAMPWVTLVGALAATGEGVIPRIMPEMRGTWTGNTGTIELCILG